MLFLFSLAINVFLFLLLALKRNKSYPDRILLIWLGMMAIHQLLFYIHFTGQSLRYPHLLGLLLPLPVLHGPLLYLYVSSVTAESRLNWKQIIPHFIPFVLLVVLAIPFYTLSATEKLQVFENNGAGYEWYMMIQIFLIMIVGLGYVLLSLVRIHRYRARIRDWFSNIEKKNLRWLEYLSIGLGIIWFLVMLFDEEVIFTGVALLVMFIGYFGINQLPIFYGGPRIDDSAPTNTDLPDSPVEEKTEDGIIPATRYAKSGLKEEEAGRLYDRLREVMEKEKLFTKNDLTLPELAARLGTHPNYLSRVINETERKNFYTYINSLRVEEFIRQAAVPENRKYTILTLAYAAGFNSKSTFNKYFREFSGKSPSEFFST
jgi:AraC-like DNA-binding protein